MNSPADLPSPIEALIRRRRTAARFDSDRPVAPEVLHRLIALATLAPQPLPLQPARFVVVESLRNRRRLRGCTFGDARLTEAPIVVLLLGYVDPPRTDLGPLLAGQVTAGSITPGESKRLGATTARTWHQLGDPNLAATRAAMAAATTLIFAAEGAGLASAWVEAFDRDQVRVAFGIPDDHVVVALVALGHAPDAAPFPGRLRLDRVISAEHFGQPWPAAMEGENVLAPDPGADYDGRGASSPPRSGCSDLPPSLRA